jgi:hypothetical protein
LQTRSRQNETAKVFTVSHPEVTVKLYDNGEVDGDTISLYLDNQLILSGKRLSTIPITITLKLDETVAEHVLVMVADNFGRIPPNTALMIVQDGDNRYQANLTSTDQKNAMVRFRYQKPLNKTVHRKTGFAQLISIYFPILKQKLLILFCVLVASAASGQN